MLASSVIAVPPVPVDGFKPSKFRWSWYPRVLRSIKAGHTLIISDHGFGKTYTARIIAQELACPMYYVSAGYGLERSTFEGQFLPYQSENGGVALQAVDGYVTAAILESARNPNGALLVIDEFFRAPGETQSALMAAMDSHRGDYTITYRGETVTVGEKFRVLACTNDVSPMYPEVEVADRAVLSRFASVVRLKYPDAKELARFMAHAQFPERHVVPTIQFAMKVRAAFDKGELDNFISPRDLVFLGKALRSGVTVQEALEDTIFGKFARDKEEALLAFWKAIEG